MLQQQSSIGRQTCIPTESLYVEQYSVRSTPGHSFTYGNENFSHHGVEQLQLLLFSSILRTKDTATGILNIQQIILSNNFKFFFIFLSYFPSHFFYQAKPAYEQSIMLHVFVSVACKAYCYTFNLPNL